MPKVLLVAESVINGQKMQGGLSEELQKTTITISPDRLNIALQEQSPDWIIIPGSLASQLLAVPTKAVRDLIHASTHQGIQRIPVTKVAFFLAEHKYVTAVHSQGQLLIEDTLNSLEQEFAGIFVRVHRNALVAIAKIEGLHKDEDGHYFVTIVGMNNKLAVSRRQLSAVRKALLCM